MLPKALDKLARDIEADVEASTRLQEALNPNDKGISRTHQLELITRVLDHACKSNSATSENAFRVALGSLRALVPFLKKKTASITDTIAAVEKYAVNFAVSSSSQDTKRSTPSYREAELSTSLQRIFSARANTPDQTIGSKRATGRRYPKRKHDKENKDPGRNVASAIAIDNELIDRLLFPDAATTLGLHMLLPNKDSVDVANTVTGALSIRLTRCFRRVCLGDIMALAEKLVIPWLNYVRTFNDATSQRTFAAYLKRITCFLFHQCRLPQNDPAIVLHTRLFALQLEDPKLNRFATDLLQSVKNFLRTAKQEKQDQHVRDTVASVYENSLRYVANYDSSDVRWISEDVSAWLDNVALVWARQKPRRPIPNVFLLRTSTFRNKPSMNMLLECFKLQIDLFNIGAYELDAEMVVPQDSRLLNQRLWNNVATALKNISFKELLYSEERAQFATYSTRIRDWRVAEADALMCLRLIRILEPLRRFISAASPKSSLTQGAKLVLRTYLGALLRGLCVLSFPVVNTDSVGSLAISDVLLRLNKAVGGAVEAARDLIRSYAQEHLFDYLENVCFAAARILQHHERDSPCAATQWKEWLFSSITSICKNIFLEQSESKSEDVLVVRLSEAVALCADQVLNGNGSTQSFSQGYWTLQIMLRDALLSRRRWWEATEISLRLFDQLTSSETESPSTNVVISQAGRMVAQDVVRLTRNGHTLTFFKDLDISGHKLLSAIIEFSWWARKNRDSFKTTSKYLETTDGLVLVRRAIFQFCDKPDLRCTVRRTHEQWLAFMDSLSCRNTGKNEKIWKAVKLNTCSGHYAIHLADPNAGEVSCANCHFQFLESLRKACEATVLGSFEKVWKLLNTMESILSANDQMIRHLEFITISVEALQWISTVLAFNSFAVSAGRAFVLADRCASFLSISTSASETRKIFRLLESLPKLHTTQDGESMINVVKTTRKEEARWSLNASRALQKAISDLKHSLKSLWKFRLGSNEENPQSSSVGGLSVDVSFDVWSVCGRHRLSLVLELVRCLFHLGSVEVDIESLSEARYYMEICVEISTACFPAKNNSFRRIASISRAKCMTRKDSRTAVQESIMKQAPIEKEDMEDGRDIYSNFCTLQSTADAMLYVEMTWNLESEASAYWDTDITHSDFAKVMYERCQRMLEDERLCTKLCAELDIERARLALNLGLTYLLKGDETTAVKLITPLSNGGTLHEDEVRAAASYQDARLSIRRAGGLRRSLSESSDHLGSHKDIPTRSRSRRRHGRTNFDKPQTPLDHTRATLSQATRDLVPSLGNFPLYRRVWKLAAMLESEPEKMASGLEKTVGLSFNARYEHNIRCKFVNQSEDVDSENVSSTIGNLETQILKLKLEDMEEPKNQSYITDISDMLTTGKSILAGVHIDEDKNSIVVWRRCTLGFHLRRVWLPSSGSQSYDGIVQRIESILCEMKQSSIKEGEAMTKDEKMSWWEKRYRLDEEMKSVLTEIQQVWLGAAVSLLIPSFSADSDAGGRVQRDFESYIELGERACDSSDHAVVLGHLVLLVDKPSERIPWESLPLLRANEIGATRTPSVSFLASTWDPGRQVDDRSIFYVVNPDGNLRRTEARFRERLRSHGWSGIAGQTSSELVAASYSGEEIYLYCGHGAGEDYFSPSKLCVKAQAPIALLMGCSSCRPQEIDIGDFESNGPAIDFLIHGSRAVVGNLWDVSDGEIDRLTSSVLSLWLGDDAEEMDVKRVSLADAVAQSRSECRLPYLVGAACIVMGVPDIYVGSHV